MLDPFFQPQPPDLLPQTPKIHSLLWLALQTPPDKVHQGPRISPISPHGQLPPHNLPVNFEPIFLVHVPTSIGMGAQVE